MTDIKYMIEHVAADLVVMLCDRFNLKFEDAIDVLYSSETYDKLSKPETGLYFQSPKYVFSFLEHEYFTGTIG